MLKKIVVALLLALSLGSISIQLALISRTEIESRVESVLKNVPTPTKAPVIDAEGVHDLVNLYRSRKNLSVLTESTNTCAIANARLIEIQENFSHDGFVQLSRAYGSYYGENLARGYIYDQNVLDGWISSPKHKENLDRQEWNHMCIRTDGNYVVQIFSY